MEKVVANFIDLVGSRFGKREVVSREPTPVYNGKKGSSRWLVRCDCGSIRGVSTSNLKHSTSCGCDKAYAIRSGKSRTSAIPSKIRANKSHLKLTFGLTLEKRDQMISDQDGKCLICKREFEETPHIDHDHQCCPGKNSCGKCIRGLLCHHCNTALGNFKDDVSILESAIEYLRRFRIILP